MSNRRPAEAYLLDENTGEPIAKTTLVTEAKSVVFDNENTLPEELEDRLAYTNSDSMPVSVGGYPAGSNFNNVPIMDVITGLLYPYTKPTISLSASPNGGIREKGVSITPITLTATTVKKTEAITRVEFLKDTTVINTITSPKQGGQETYSYPTAITTDCSLSAKVTDAKGSVVESAKIAYTFVHPAYVGSLDDAVTIPNSDQIKAMSKKVVAKSNISNVFSIDNKRMCFACPPGWTLSKIVDQNGFDITASFTNNTVVVNCADGTNQNYKVYVSSPTTQINFTVKFNI